MSYADLFHCLSDLCKLGSQGWKSLERVESVVMKMKEYLWWCQEDTVPCKSAHASAVVLDESCPRRRIRTSVKWLMLCIDSTTRSDIRVECGCLAAAILQEIQYQLQMVSCKSLPNVMMADNGAGDMGRRKNPIHSAPPSLISVHQTKVAEDASRVIMYTVVLGCLDADASLYVKMMLAKNKFVLGSSLPVVSRSCCHNLLASIMKILLPVMKHESLGVGLRQSLFPEILSAVLELCFCPAEVRSYPDDTAFFREQLETLITTMNTRIILQHLLLLLGIVKGGVWLGKVCRSLLVRRFLMKAGGVGAVVSAGLAICSDKHDWQLCEAIALLIAQSRISDVDLFFTTLGPQLLELIEQDDLQPDVFRVVVLIVAKLAERSATLTAVHITNTLLQPLLNTTLPDAPCLCKNSNLTAGVNRIYKLFVEIPPPSTVFTNLLRPILNPLVMISALATTYLRTLARQIIFRYLSALPKENTVEALLILSGLKICAESPPVNPAIKFSVDEDGGVKVDVLVESLHNNNLEDENICTCLISVLESLKNSAIVLLFYEKLASYIDFTTLNKKETPYRALVTDEDVKARQIMRVRTIVMCCSLLTHLSENEQLTSELFMNLSAAVPVVDTLINIGCQKCEDEHLQEIQISLIINVLMLVSCYVSDRTLRKKMASEDWIGLKSLLPSLEKIEQNRSTETVLMFVEKLRNLVLTHGAVNSFPRNIGGAKDARNISSENVKEHFDSSVSHSAIVNSQDMNTNEDSSINTHSKANNADTCINLQVNNSNEIDQEINMNTARKESSYKEAMEDLFSPLLPVRGHALLALSKLVDKRDEETMSHKRQLLSIFQHNLKEEDSYLYLMAVEGLAVLCDAFPDKVVEMLTQEFSLGNRCVEDRAKLVEALTRATKRLGPLLPHYKDFFINSLLNGIRDEEAIVRAASLSGLGDVCKLLQFSLGPVVHEVFGLLYNVVKSDTVVEVRRAAVLALTLLLQGLGRHAFTVLQDVMRDLYRALRLIHATDPDDVVRLHAQLAIVEIDAITREFLLPKLNLTKRIYVTDMPPSAH